MSYWLACVPYFRIKDVKRESENHLWTHTHHTHKHTHINPVPTYTHTPLSLQDFFFTWWGHRCSELNFEGMGCGRHRSNTMKLFYLRFHLFLFLTSRWLISCFISNQGGRGLWRVLVREKTLNCCIFVLVVWVTRYEQVLAAKMSSLPIGRKKVKC